MKRIKLSDYKNNMGIVIDLEEEYIYKLNHFPGSINIPFNKLMFNYKTLLSKDKKYYLICSGGHKSKRAVSILELYGYDVTQLYKE